MKRYAFLLCALALIGSAQNFISFTSANYSILYMRVVRGPLPSWMEWKDPEGFVVSMRPQRACHAYDIQTKMSDGTTYPQTATIDKNLGTATFFLQSNATPQSVSVTCLQVETIEEVPRN